MKRAVALTVAGFILASCGGAGLGMGGVVSASAGGEYISSYYTPSLVSYVARDGRFPVVVRGNPFGGVPQVQLEQAVHTRGRLPGWAPRAQLVKDEAAEAAIGQRLVVVFNAAGNVDFRTLCNDLAGVPTGGPANQMTVRVAFCDGNQTMSSVGLQTAPPPDEQNAAFIGALNSAINIALPFVDRTREGV